MFELLYANICVTTKFNTPGTAGGPGGRDRTLAVKSRKTSEKSPFFLKKIKFTQKKIFLGGKFYFFTKKN